jgi:hypothetical protein
MDIQITREEMYPPIPESELRDCHSFNDLTRVVVTENAVYARYRVGGWFKLMPKSEARASGQ